MLTESQKKFWGETKRKGFNLKEWLTRSEAPEVFVDVLNEKLMAGVDPLEETWTRIYDEIPMTQGQSMRFPAYRGVGPDLVPELAEYVRMEGDLTSTTVEVQKFGELMGFSREMIDDNNITLINRATINMGRYHSQLRQREHFKCINAFSTLAVSNTANFVVGRTDHGFRYPTLGYTNSLSATGDSWETRILRGVNQLMNQTVTITAKGIDIEFSIMPDTIISHPANMKDIQKVLNASITVVAAGVNGTTNVAGNNVFGGMLPNQIFTPVVQSSTTYILRSKVGLVSLRKDNIELDEFRNFYFDAQDIKSRERFMPAVVEERTICELLTS